MSSAWPKIRLGELLNKSSATVTTKSDELYSEITVKLWGKGVALRSKISGAGIASQRRFLAKSGQFIISRIDARNGAMGIVPEELDGALVSNDFPLYDIDSEKLDTKYISWITKTAWFVESCKRASEGTTNRVRLKEELFLSLEISLPPLAEQQRIVARIEEIAQKALDAVTLRAEATLETEALMPTAANAIFSELKAKYTPSAFGAFSPHVTSGPRNWGKHYEQKGSRFYRAQDIGPHGRVLGGHKVFISPPPGKQGRVAMLSDGDIMLVITGATVGRVAVFSADMEPGFVSQHVAICRFEHDVIFPDFVLWGLRSRGGQEQLLGQRYGQGKPGLNLNNIRALSLPFPPIAEQRRIAGELDSLQAEVNELERLQTKTSGELDALLPSVLAQAFNGEF